MEATDPDDHYDPAAYGRSFADVYDSWYGDVSDLEATVEFVAAFAEDGLVLELGIGTGRIALPLSRRGIRVAGIDASPEMIDVLRQKPGGPGIPVQIADMADPAIRTGPPARIVLAAYNTLVNLPSEASQRSCLANVAGRLEPDGYFVNEMFVPATTMSSERRATPTRLGGDQTVLAATRVDTHRQLVHGEHIELTAEGIRVRPWRLRYLYPAQIDEMAANVGLHLVGRWAGWRRQPFTEDSVEHVSVYRLD